jgi:lipoprotein-anchoring transpeptidase ErfK/SrfK
MKNAQKSPQTISPLSPPLFRLLAAAAAALLAIFFSASCRMPVNSGGGGAGFTPQLNLEQKRAANEQHPPSSLAEAAAPTIEIASSGSESVESGSKLINSDRFKITVNAPAAREVDLLYQPVTASDRAVKLKTISAADAAAAENSGRFEIELPTPADLNGEIWARARYADGAARETEKIAAVVGSFKTRASENGAETRLSSNTNTDADSAAADSAAQAADDNESARSDHKTGGRVEKAALRAGNGNIRITVNVPAFLLTFWQDGKEIESFYVGVGRKNYPIPIGPRAASEIILNPDWIPPDSEWVRSAGIEPYTRIPASDPDNPLGKIKIPLGQAYLLHEAQGRSDIGKLVSHGCVRVLREDIFALTRMIVAARGASISNREIAAARKDSKRRVITLEEEIPVDINYDTMVVEGGVLRIYPDVYEQKTNTVEELRAELESYKIDVSKLDDAVLKKMLESVNADRKFVVPLADIRAGRALEKGKTEPLTPYQVKKSARGKAS